MSDNYPKSQVTETSKAKGPIQGQKDSTMNNSVWAQFMDLPTLLRYKNDTDTTVWDTLNFHGCKAEVFDKLFPKIRGKGKLKPPDKFRSSAAKIQAWRNMTREEQDSSNITKYKERKAIMEQKSKERNDDASNANAVPAGMDNMDRMARYMDIPTLRRHKNNPDSTVWDSLCFDGCTMACFNEIFPKVPRKGDLKPPERYRRSAATVQAWRNMTKRQQHDDNLKHKSKESKEAQKRQRQKLIERRERKKRKSSTGEAAASHAMKSAGSDDSDDGTSASESDDDGDGDGLAMSPRKLEKRIQEVYDSLKDKPNWEELFMNEPEVKGLIFLFARYHKITDGIFLGQTKRYRGVSVEYLFCRPCSSYARDDGSACDSCKMMKITNRRNHDGDSSDCDACRKVNGRIRKAYAKKEVPNPKKTKARELSRKQLKEKLKRAVKDHENVKYKLEEARSSTSNGIGNSLSNGINKNGAAKTSEMNVDDGSVTSGDKEKGEESDESSILQDVAKFIKSNRNQCDDASKKLLGCLVKSMGEMNDEHIGGNAAVAAATSVLTHNDHDEFISETLGRIKDYVAGIRQETMAGTAESDISL